MKYLLSLSGGVASAVAADRAIARYGRDSVELAFADTSWEDEDLHRFLADLMARWGGPLTTFRDGRTPLEVAEDKQIIPNSNVAPCSHELKVKHLDRAERDGPRPVTRLLGLDWREMHRVDRMRAKYTALEADGRYVDFPLLWKPLEFRPYTEVVRSWGIEVPRLYRLGFPHNNCGGRCVKQGIGEWLRLRDAFPERFAEVRDWELAQRAKGGPRADFAILSDRQGGERKRVPLAALADRQPGQVGLPLGDDRFSCFCGDGEVA